jgi:hypothetical protein
MDVVAEVAIKRLFLFKAIMRDVLRLPWKSVPGSADLT